jgi:hypothetical protein
LIWEIIVHENNQIIGQRESPSIERPMMQLTEANPISHVVATLEGLRVDMRCFNFWFPIGRVETYSA